MTRPPEFDEVVEGVEDAEERARLERVHRLLVETGPPPDLPFSLLATPTTARHLWSRPRRASRRFVLAAAASFCAFAIGYVVGSPMSAEDRARINATRTIHLTGAGEATGAIGIAPRDASGNLPMILTVTGLERLQGGDYYRLALAQDGKPIVTCVTFNAAGPRTTIRFVAAYDLEGFDGWVVTRWDAETHDEKPVLRADRI